jgi:hypothetical protein
MELRVDHDQGLAPIMTDGTPDPRSVLSHWTYNASHLDKPVAHCPAANGVGKSSAGDTGERNARPPRNLQMGRQLAWLADAHGDPHIWRRRRAREYADLGACTGSRLMRSVPESSLLPGSMS